MYIQTCGEEDVKCLLTQAHACKHTHTHTQRKCLIFGQHIRTTISGQLLRSKTRIRQPTDRSESEYSESNGCEGAYGYRGSKTKKNRE